MIQPGRRIEYDLNSGFILNGEVTKIKGMCNHQARFDSGFPLAILLLKYYEFKLDSFEDCNALSLG